MDRLQALDRKIAHFREQRAAVVARKRAQERKRDTRCKILIGGGLLALVKDGDADAAAVYHRIMGGLDERAATAFEGWAGEPSVQTPSVQTPEEPA